MESEREYLLEFVLVDGFYGSSTSRRSSPLHLCIFSGTISSTDCATLKRTATLLGLDVDLTPSVSGSYVKHSLCRECRRLANQHRVSITIVIGIAMMNCIP